MFDETKISCFLMTEQLGIYTSISTNTLSLNKNILYRPQDLKSKFIPSKSLSTIRKLGKQFRSTIILDNLSLTQTANQKHLEVQLEPGLCFRF